MSQKQSDHILLRRHFDDADHMTESARGYDLDFQQLDPGPFRADMLQTQCGNVLLTCGRINRRLRQRGAIPPGMRTFVVPLRSDLRMHWRGHDVTGDQLLAFPLGAELEAVSRPDFHVCTLTVPDEMIDEVADESECDEIKTLTRSAEVISCDPAAMAHLRETLNHTCTLLMSDAAHATDPDLFAAIAHDLPRQVFQTLAAGRQISRRLPNKGDLALRQAEWVITGWPPHTPLTVRRLCHQVRVSERTLEYAFRERFGVSPKTYLKARQLNNVRRNLRRADPSSTQVHDVAGRCGFWHMGQFAADYRRMFGELPSHTLRDCRTKT